MKLDPLHLLDPLDAAKALQDRLDKRHARRHKLTDLAEFRAKQNSGQNDLVALSQKIQQDIEFLEDRISRMLNLHKSNPILLKNYESMLDNRRSVLKWCHDQSLSVTSSTD